MTSVRLLTRIQAVALVWLIVLVWLSQSAYGRLRDSEAKDESDTSDERENILLKAIRPLEADLKPVWFILKLEIY
jgi:hypothetical protein